MEHLRREGYHPRSNKHSDTLAQCIVTDLLALCPPLRRRARDGEIVYDLNFDLHVRTATWNVDLVLGRPAVSVALTDQDILRAPPSTTEIAIEIKSVMTEHRKAVKNRKRDLEAHHEHVRGYSPRTISGGVFVLNQALQFASPLRSEPIVHGGGKRDRVQAVVSHCISEMRNVEERADVSRTGLDAKCVIVVDMDNINLPAAAYQTRPPAPQVGDPLHYDAFLQKICSLYQERFL